MNNPEIQSKIELFKFGGRVESIIENKCRASLSLPSREQDAFIANLFSSYEADGKPHSADSWIEKRLEGFFNSVDNPPKWVEDLPSWPWLNGKPMVFLRQFSVPNNEVATAHVVPNVEIYVFGARVPTSGGWKMEYRVVEQRGELKGLVALVESESGPHTPANTKLIKRKG